MELAKITIANYNAEKSGRNKSILKNRLFSNRDPKTCIGIFRFFGMRQGFYSKPLISRYLT